MKQILNAVINSLKIDNFAGTEGSVVWVTVGACWTGEKGGRYWDQ